MKSIMKKILIAVVLMTLMAGSALALDVKNAEEPTLVDAGGRTLTTLTYTSRTSCPTQVPGNILLPAPEPIRSGDDYLYLIYITCSTDDVSIYPVHD